MLATAVTIIFATNVLAREINGSAYVRDRDKIVVSGTPVRLDGVDAPETYNRYGRESKTFKQRLLRGKTLTCELNG